MRALGLSGSKSQIAIASVSNRKPNRRSKSHNRLPNRSSNRGLGALNRSPNRIAAISNRSCKSRFQIAVSNRSFRANWCGAVWSGLPLNGPALRLRCADPNLHQAPRRIAPARVQGAAVAGSNWPPLRAPVSVVVPGGGRRCFNPKPKSPKSQRFKVANRSHDSRIAASNR